MHWYLEGFRRYFDFTGRTRRRGYWIFSLFHIIVTVLVIFADAFTGTLNPQTGLGIIGWLYTLFSFIPGLAITARRLQDTGKAGWWLLLIFVPFIGAIAIFGFTLQDSEAGANDFGPNPKT